MCMQNIRGSELPEPQPKGSNRLQARRLFYLCLLSHEVGIFIYLLRHVLRFYTSFRCLHSVGKRHPKENEGDDTGPERGGSGSCKGSEEGGRETGREGRHEGEKTWRS